MEKWITVGKILGSRGVKGEVKVQPLTDDPTRFSELEELYVIKDGRYTAHPINAVRYHQNLVLITFSDITDRNNSDLLRGCELAVPREKGVELSEDEFYIVDLIGTKLYDPDGGLIGVINDILTTTGTVNTVEIALNSKKKMIYVPFRKVYFKNWDSVSHSMTADIPQDFFEL